MTPADEYEVGSLRKMGSKKQNMKMGSKKEDLTDLLNFQYIRGTRGSGCLHNDYYRPAKKYNSAPRPKYNKERYLQAK